MTTQTTPNSSEPYEAIKLGIDAHAQWSSVSRQVDGATPQRVRKMTFEEIAFAPGVPETVRTGTGVGE